MKLFENIRGVAGGNFGLVTAAEARKLGVGSFQLARWVKMGGVGRFGREYWLFVAPGVACHECGHAFGC